MKAYVLHGIDQLRLETVEDPVPGDQEIILKVEAAGICGSDIPRIYKTGAYTHPLIPGHEFSGSVVALGRGVEKYWKNKRAGVFPLIPCYTCRSCRKKQYEMCENYSYLGSRRDGGFAEYVAVPVSNLIELPETVSYEAAAMLEPMAVAVHAIKRVCLEKKAAVAICGLGTIGLLILMLLRESGIENIFAIGNKDFQKEGAVRMGLNPESYCDSRYEDVHQWVMEHTGNQGVDVFFECVGKNETILHAIHASAPAGKIMLVGNPETDVIIDKTIYWKILRNQLTILGSWNSTFTGDNADDWHYALEGIEKERVIPEILVTHRFSLETLEKGFHIMRDKTDDYVKIMGIF